MTTTDVPTVVRYGLTTVVLGERFSTRVAPTLPQGVQVAWWRRTDYGWVCSAPECADSAGVNFRTRTHAKWSADKHAAGHGDATVIAGSERGGNPS